MITTDMILHNPNGSYNYFELCKYAMKTPDAFPIKYFPNIVSSDTSDDTFFERMCVAKNSGITEQRLFVLVNNEGVLYGDSYSKYIEMPSYPCHIAMLTRIIDINADQMFTVSYLTNINDVKLNIITLSNEVIFTIGMAEQDFDFKINRIYSEISSSKFRKTL